MNSRTSTKLTCIFTMESIDVSKSMKKKCLSEPSQENETKNSH